MKLKIAIIAMLALCNACSSEADDHKERSANRKNFPTLAGAWRSNQRLGAETAKCLERDFADIPNELSIEQVNIPRSSIIYHGPRKDFVENILNDIFAISGKYNQVNIDNIYELHIIVTSTISDKNYLNSEINFDLSEIRSLYEEPPGIAAPGIAKTVPLRDLLIKCKYSKLSVTYVSAEAMEILDSLTFKSHSIVIFDINNSVKEILQEYKYDIENMVPQGIIKVNRNKPISAVCFIDDPRYVDDDYGIAYFSTKLAMCVKYASASIDKMDLSSNNCKYIMDLSSRRIERASNRENIIKSAVLCASYN